MTLGEKIRKYRSLKNMTQKELGMAIGFSAATADSRIRKYERDVMAPKQDIRLKLASVLDVDLSALSDNDIHNEEDIMQVLFLLEEEYGITIDRLEDKTIISFDNNKKENAKLSGYLYTWYRQKGKLEDSLGIGEESDYKARQQYEHWKARFPKDNVEYWEEQKEKINIAYSPDIDNLLNTSKEIEKISEFIGQLRQMIQSGITIESTVKTFGPGDGGLVLRFLVSEILDLDNAEHREEFTRFFFMINTIESYGMPVYVDLLSKEQGTFICYTLRLSSIMAISSILVKIQNYEKHRNEMTDWDTEMFETDYEEDLKYYNNDFKGEIQRR